MMKSWGDDCSSDEEDSHHGDAVDDEVHPMEEPKLADKEVGGGGDSGASVERTYDYPNHPPYTAFVGNLSFRIKEEKELQQAVADAVLQRFGERIEVIGVRISYDRVDPTKHRGFGYVEVETLEQVGFVQFPMI
jgi:RNA recognition motif-containing protein